MKAFLLFLFLCFSQAVVANPPAMTLQQGGTVVRLFPLACTHEAVLDYLLPEARSFWRSGTVLWNSRVYALCWRATGDGSVVLIDETGDAGILPLSVFRPEEWL
jgi:hypothetical protein